MIHINPLLKCHTLELLDQYVGETGKCRVLIGNWGGRRFTNAAQNAHFSFTLNQLVSQLITLAENPAEDAFLIRSLIQKIRKLDAARVPRVSILRRMLTAARRFFGNFVFNRKALLKEIEQKLPIQKPVKAVPIEPPVIHLNPESIDEPKYQEPAVMPKTAEYVPFVKTPEPAEVPKPQVPLTPSLAKNQKLRNWLNNPAEGFRTTAFFMEIKDLAESPYNRDRSVESLLKQCSENHEIDLNHPHALLLLEGIFKHCIIDKLNHESEKIDFVNWLSRQPTFSPQALNAALIGHLAHKTPDFTTLNKLITCIQTLQMKEMPESLGRALAKMVQLDANSNPFERVFEYLLKEKLIQETDYHLILDEFRIKRADPKKEYCNWKILTWLQERSKQEGWK